MLFLLKIGSWRAVFVVLTLFGCLAAFLVTRYRETLTERRGGPLLAAWLRLDTVLRNPRFAFLQWVFALAPICLMSFIGSAAFIYIDGFGLTEQAFSLIFALSAACAMGGPMLYMRLSRGLPVQAIILGGFLVIATGGALIAPFGSLSSWLFAGLAAVSTEAVIVLRVPGANLLLEQQKSDTGSATAPIHFASLMLGAAAVQIVVAHTGDLTRTLGLLFVIVGVSCAILWRLVQNRPFVATNVTGAAGQPT